MTTAERNAELLRAYFDEGFTELPKAIPAEPPYRCGLNLPNLCLAIAAWVPIGAVLVWWLR